ncbi:MAG: flagellar hook-basal body complex protein FliE [Candidatus Melainabacteria bacterium]
MQAGYIPKLSINKAANPFDLGVNPTSGTSAFALQPSHGAEKPSFHNVMMNTLGNVNETLAAPDKMMMDAMTTGTVDIHDVMIATSKAELTVTVASQVATKVVQAYDRILQIQI